MKRVLLFSDGWKRLLTYAWTAGAMDWINRTGAGITIDQFNCWGDWSLNEGFNRGEYDIYRLPDLSQYDGIIIDTNNITHKDVLNGLLDRVRASGLPAVSLCADFPGFYYAGINGHKAINGMIRHLYEKHGCRSFFFAGGPKGNYENEERARAFHDAMIDLGLPKCADRIIYSDFDANGGHLCMKYILEHSKKLPDAVVCANDNIAVGLIGEAEAHGYKVPRDFRVTGFDYFDKAAWFEPQLTTAVLHREAIGALAVQVLEKCWDGEVCPHYNYTEARLIFTESCGCPNTGVIDYRGYVRNQVLGIIKEQNTDEEIARLESDLSDSPHTDTFALRVAEEYGKMDCDGCAVFMKREILDPDDSFVDGVSSLTEDRDRPDQACAIASVGKHLDIRPGEEIGTWLRSRSASDQGSVYYHIPLHVDTIPAGTVVFKNPRFLLVHFDIFEIQEAILFVLHSLYQKARLTAALNALQRIYDRDPLTGIYTRAAFDEKLRPFYRKWDEQNRAVAFLFVDVDHFKKINDTHGHAFGDKVLRFVAHVMQEFLPDGGFVCRYGGDEFLAVFPYETDDEIVRYREKIEQRLSSIRISLSIGLHKKTAGSFEENVEAADRAMYEVKIRHHGRKCTQDAEETIIK